MAGVLAQDEPRQTGPDFGKASPFGLIVVLLLLIGTFALVWSMNGHLRRLPKSFDTENPENPDDPDSASEDPVDWTMGVDPDTPEPPADGTARGPS
ncbi:MAG: hypothetical protein K0U69_11920 [Actinomycetia bacterium]|nr:hypothetical protein [Actinomycetes bacterium]MCH9710200.1 hypothetical protein [Actinomycetes bacterium]